MRLLDHSPAAEAAGLAREHWRARLSLGFADDRGTTRLIERSHFGPLRVQKPLYPEHPSVCHAIVVHPPGGVVGGDQLAINASVGAGAHAFITTPGAAKWYRANGHVSRQEIKLQLDAGAALEWLPQETIFYNGADVCLDTEVSMAADASFITSDIFCFGRTASGERFDHGRVSQRLQVRRGGRLLWFEQGALHGGDADFDGPLGLNGRTVCATLLAVGRQVGAACMQALREDACPGFGVTQMKSVLVVRYIGDSSQEARRLMHRAWRLLRPALLEREAVTPRVWNT
ncbi:MAG: urease accessory protein UreD [Noviherbaspirillum sp.]